MYKGLVPGTDCPGGQWTEDRVPPPSLAPVLKSWNWCLNRPLQEGQFERTVALHLNHFFYLSYFFLLTCAGLYGTLLTFQSEGFLLCVCVASISVSSPKDSQPENFTDPLSTTN